MTVELGLSAAVADALAGALDRDPVQATYLGDHLRDALLPDPSKAAARERAAQLRAQLAALDALELDARDDIVDAAVLQTVLAAELFDLDDLREAEWNPMLHNPGNGLHALLSREFAPLPQRLLALTGRLAAAPGYLAAARERLTAMCGVHLETALDQLAGTVHLIDVEVPAAVRRAGVDIPGLAAASAAARAALEEHQAWLAAQQDAATRSPRLGPELFRAKLALALDTAIDPESLLESAEAELERTSADIAAEAGRFAGVAQPDAATVRAVLDEIAADTPDDATILLRCTDALAETTAFVRDHDLVTIYDDPVDIVEMPEIDRGVAVAYCQESGPLEPVPVPTRFAVSPTPADWTADRVASFYREYNDHMLHNLTVHEAMPGHALQLMHANRHRGSTPVRAVWMSGSFVEGWAVYTEELMAAYGYRSAVSARAAAAVRMQQLKMRLRTVLNAILDIRFHCSDLDEREAMRLMRERGFQEDGESAGKWRRVQLTATQLCTYYVGYVEVLAVAQDLRAAHPTWAARTVHDAMLAHGSPPARHLRTLLGLHAVDA